MVGCLGLVLGNGAVGSQREEANSLSEGVRIEQKFTGATKSTFVINLRVGEFVHLTVEQKGVDVVAELATTSQVILTQDSPNGQLGIECIAYVARDSGQHRLTVTSLGGSGDGQAGSIEIHVIAHRIATSADRIHSDVEHSLAAAEQFRLKNTAASRAEAIDLFRYRSAARRTTGAIP